MSELWHEMAMCLRDFLGSHGYEVGGPNADRAYTIIEDGEVIQELFSPPGAGYHVLMQAYEIALEKVEAKIAREAREQTSDE